MKLYHKLIVLLLPIIALCSTANSLNIVVNIHGQWLTIWTPANIELGSFSSPTTKTFTDYFWIEDLRATKTWHYTSIQWTVYWSDGQIVSWATVWFRTNSDNIILIWWEQDNTDFNRNLSNSNFTDITNPVLLFYRNDNPSHSWYFNKYWFMPSIHVNIPSGSSGPYTVRLSYTLYDMPTSITPQ